MDSTFVIFVMGTFGNCLLLRLGVLVLAMLASLILISLLASGKLPRLLFYSIQIEYILLR